MRTCARANLNKPRNCCVITFEDPDPDSETGVEKGEFYVRGAVAWPKGIHKGFCIVAGQHLQTGVVVVFEQFYFSDMTSWIPEIEGKKLFVEGFAKIAERNILKYGCIHYFITVDKGDETHTRNMIELRKQRHIKLKPRFVPVRYRDQQNVDRLIFLWNSQNKLLKYDNTFIHNSIRAIKYIDSVEKDRPAHDSIADPHTDPPYSPNTIEALRSLVAGYTMWPHRTPRLTDKFMRTFDKDDFLNW